MNLKILQWNVFYKEDVDKIVAEIKRIDPDIVCAQELIQHLSKTPQIDTAKEIAEKLNYEYVYQTANTWTGRDVKEAQGNAIFSKHPILSSSYHFLQPLNSNPPDAEHEGRVYLEVNIAVHDTELQIGTTHLSYSHKFQITDHRKKEINNLLEILTKKKQKYVFTADLNSTPDSYTITEILKIQDVKNPGPDFGENTWTTKPFDYHGFKEDALRWRLDYVFTTQDLNVIDSKIIATDVSDHLPILLEIEI